MTATAKKIAGLASSQTSIYDVTLPAVADKSYMIPVPATGIEVVSGGNRNVRVYYNKAPSDSGQDQSDELAQGARIFRPFKQAWVKFPTQANRLRYGAAGVVDLRLRIHAHAQSFFPLDGRRLNEAGDIMSWSHYQNQALGTSLGTSTELTLMDFGSLAGSASPFQGHRGIQQHDTPFCYLDGGLYFEGSAAITATELAVHAYTRANYDTDQGFAVTGGREVLIASKHVEVDTSDTTKAFCYLGHYWSPRGGATVSGFGTPVTLERLQIPIGDLKLTVENSSGSVTHDVYGLWGSRSR